MVFLVKFFKPLPPQSKKREKKKTKTNRKQKSTSNQDSLLGFI